MRYICKYGINGIQKGEFGYLIHYIDYQKYSKLPGWYYIKVELNNNDYSTFSYKTMDELYEYWYLDIKYERKEKLKKISKLT